jgi:HK97 family phage prohead protease
MAEKAKPDFSGWATKAGLKCSDGRTIMPDAFKHQHEETVPLVWQHNHSEPSNVLGYATLEHREDGVYAYGFFNDTPQGQNAKKLVQHKDIKSLSIYANQLTERSKQVLHGFIRELSLVLSGANPGALIDKKDEKDDPVIVHEDTNDQEGRRMTRNVFEQQNEDKNKDKHVLTHDAVRGIVEDAQKAGSLKEAVERYALKHGIENIEVLFPDARTVTDTPEFDQRRVEWVSGVINGTKHSPFSRIKSIWADITYDDARAKGYIKGNLKKEEYFGVATRVTTPSTVYKKQKLDRDDIIDITDFDVVIWLKAEMRLMLDEELARAVLIGDGRDVADEDKIRDPMGAPEGAGIRSILHDHDLYAATITVDDTATATEVVDGIISAMGFYKGSGNPTFYTTLPTLTQLMLTRDQFEHRMWKTPSELAAELGVSNIVTVEVMENEADLIGIIVNLKDYTIGADRGGEVSFFDDFDIDYNQYKYLLETRVSGALTRIRSAMVIKRAGAGATLVTPVEPAFDGTTVTVPTTSGVVYKNKDTGATLTTAAPVVLAAGQSLTVEATPASSATYFASNENDQWTFENES